MNVLHPQFAPTRQLVSRFRRSEDGSMVIFGVFMLIVILLITGMAVDFMRIETTRARMQGTVDRAVLAAADLDQTLDPASVVKDYFAKAGLDATLTGEPKVQQGLAYRVVTAGASADVPMLFAGLAEVVNPTSNAIDQMTVPVRSTAQEKVAKVEISLVLDISGSMGSSGRIGNLRTAATEFVDTVLNGENADMVSVSLVPYSEEVSMGADLFNILSKTRSSAYDAYCFDFEEADYDTTVIDPTHEYLQTQWFQWTNSGSNNLSTPVCATKSYAQIQPWSNNTSDLKYQISQLQPYSQTSIFLGMKWGAGLLDPAMQPVVETLISQGKVDSAFSGRPVAYSDGDTLKFIILMTDGVNTNSYRIQDWAYDTESEQYHWYRYNLIWYLNKYVSSKYRSSYYYVASNRTIGDRRLDQICTAAKDAGIIVWTIGFELGDSTASRVMADCASSASHFYEVQGIEISKAFASIASQINNLKLVE